MFFYLRLRDVDKLAALIGETTEDLQVLDQVADVIRQLGWDLENLAAPWEPPEIDDARVVEIKRTPATCYRSELVSCGKERCRCMRRGGKLHGPYWYAYQRKNGKVTSRYVGKTLSGENTA